MGGGGDGGVDLYREAWHNDEHTLKRLLAATVSFLKAGKCRICFWLQLRHHAAMEATVGYKFVRDTCDRVDGCDWTFGDLTTKNKSLDEYKPPLKFPQHCVNETAHYFAK